VDDQLFDDLNETFPELKTAESLIKLNENEMKSAKGKERWRNFIMKVSLSCYGTASFIVTDIEILVLSSTHSTKNLFPITISGPSSEGTLTENMTRTTPS
jgi:hypothetical protein